MPDRRARRGPPMLQDPRGAPARLQSDQGPPTGQSTDGHSLTQAFAYIQCPSNSDVVLDLIKGAAAFVFIFHVTSGFLVLGIPGVFRLAPLPLVLSRH